MENILQKLKSWRDDLAAKAGKPAYYILTNKNLEDAFNLNPQDPKELEQLSGWGPKKVEKYGREVLRLINNQEKEIENEKISSEEEGVILSVSQYINFVNISFQQFGELKVVGEINDLSGVERGLAFFNLKDTRDLESTMQCVVFRNQFNYLSHLLEEGLEVVIYGLPSVYSKNGNFKFVVTKIEPVGEGGFKKALEILKKKLIAKGYFAEERKRELPEIIKKIGLITSSNGAAIHDFKKNLADFGFKVFLKNVYVEGDLAENSIINAINFFNKSNGCPDVLVVIRGGGSLESLKAYNCERVVEAIVSSKIPVVTGVGHESDETFAGLSSDFDCSTPSIVATFLSQSRENIFNKNLELFEELRRSEERVLLEHQNKISFYLNNLSLSVEGIFNKFNQLVQKITSFLNEKIFQISGALQKADVLAKRMTFLAENNLKNKENLLEVLGVKINVLSPQNVLDKGYAVVKSKTGQVLDSVKKIKVGNDIKVQLRDGQIEAKVFSKNPRTQDTRYKQTSN